MSRFFLTRLQIEGFRGINNDGDPLDISFKTDKVNSVFGENARGKSSLFDALSYAFTGSIPKLAGLPADDEPENYFCNRFHSTEIASITVTVEEDTGAAPIELRVTRDKHGNRTVDSPTGHSSPSALLSELAGELTLLDYNTFRRFVEDSPLKRGRTFSSLLGLSRLSALRQTLEVLANERNLKGDLALDTDELRQKQFLSGIETQKQRIFTAKNKLLGDSAKSMTDLAAIGQATSDALSQVPLLVPHVAGNQLMQLDFTAIHSAIRNAEGSDKRSTLDTTKKAIAALKKLEPETSEITERSELGVFIAQRDEALKLSKGPLLFQVYKDVAKVFDNSAFDIMVCPACDWRHEQRQDEATKARLEKYSDVASTREKLSAFWKICKVRTRFKDLESDAAIRALHTQQRWAHLDTAFCNGDASENDLGEVFTRLGELDATRISRTKELLDEQIKLENELPPSLVALTEKVNEAEEIHAAMTELLRLSREYASIVPLIKEKQRWKTFIEYAATTFADAEISLSTAQATAFETRYRRLYDQITRNPDIVPVLRKTKGGEDLHLRLEKFHSLKDLSATTLLPESYRNALAISIFLAAALASTKAARFVVFDDVTSSFDAGHQFWLMEVLRMDSAYPVNSAGLQIILLSHDGLLEKYFDRMHSETEWNHCRLNGLAPCGNVSAGPQDSNQIRLDAEKFTRAGLLNQAKPLIRQHLEQSLLCVIQSLEIPVPMHFSIRDESKAVQACLDAINNALDLHEKARSLIVTASQLSKWRTVIVTQIVGNYLAHYATSVGASISPSFYLSLLTTIDDAVDCFKYDCRCQSTVKRVFYRSLEKKHRAKNCFC
jgi:hypothetical protein